MQSKLFKKFGSNSSIEFTNVSYEEYKEGNKMMVEEDYSHETKNIESLYMTAQLILDDLSSRPLTR